VQVELAGNYGGILMEGDTFGFIARPEAASYILLLDIDPAGNVNVLYPYKESELQQIKGSAVLNLAGLGEVVAPFGTEYLKVFAFERQPVELKKIMGKTLTPGSSLYKVLEQMVGINPLNPGSSAEMRNDVAQSTIRLASYPGNEKMEVAK
jgi:hypothetical protein